MKKETKLVYSLKCIFANHSVFKNSIILIFLFAILSQSGIVSVFTILKISQHKKMVKQMMKQELKDGKHNEDLVVFTEKDLKSAIWEHSKEFFLGEDKFDIVRVENGVEGKKFYCINDQKEKALFQNLDKQKKSNNVFEDVSKKFKFNSDKHEHTVNQYLAFIELSFPEWKDNYSFNPYFSFLRPPSVNS